LVEKDFLEKVRNWVEKDFSMIPVALLQKAYPYSDEIRILAPTFEDFKKQYHDENCDLDCENCDTEECWESYRDEAPVFPMWGYVFKPNDPSDEKWIKRHAKEVYEKTGFIVYETDELGVYLGVNGAGYDFYNAHWIPLYKLRFKEVIQT